MPLTPQEELELLELEEQEHQAAASASPSQPKPSRPAEAGLEAFGQSATAGYLPQLQAGASQLVPNPSKSTDEKLRAQGFQINQPEDGYVANRDQFINRGKQLEEENPEASLAGTAAGIGASMMVPGGAIGGIGKSALRGAIQGAAYNPGDVEGKIDPLQLEDRAINAAQGGALGGVAGAASKGLQNLSRRQQMINQVKDSANLPEFVKKEIDAAKNTLRQKEIVPKEITLQELIKGKSGKVNPEIIRKGGFENLASSMEKGVAPGERSEMSLKNLIKARRAFDKGAKYSPQTVLDTASQAKVADKKIAADVLRNAIREASPEAAETISSMAPALKLEKALSKASNKDPLAFVKSKPGTMKNSLLDKIDQTTGSNLEGLGGEISTATSNLLDPSKIMSLRAPEEVKKLLYRAAIKGGDVASQIPNVSDPAIRALLESERESKK